METYTKDRYIPEASKGSIEFTGGRYYQGELRESYNYNSLVDVPFGKVETITSTSGCPKDFNPVSHRKREDYATATAVEHEDEFSIGDWSYSIKINFTDVTLLQAEVDSLYRPIGPDVYNDLYRHPKELAMINNRGYGLLSYSSLLGTESALLANFIAELRDLRRIVDFVRYHGPLTDKRVAEGWLGLNFGIIPLVSDLKAISNIVSNMDKIIDKWNSLNGKTLNLHDSFNLVDTESENYYDRELVVGPVGQWSVYRETFEALKQVSQCTVSAYVIPKPVDKKKKIELQMELLGLNSPLSIVWEAMPWSWVIDYVTNIGKVLETYEQGSGLLDYKLVSGGYSITTDIEVRHEVTPIVVNNYNGAEKAYQPSQLRSSQRTYNRNPSEFGLPDYYGALDDTHFGWRQASYLLALGITRR